jgi:hypothetical protein
MLVTDAWHHGAQERADRAVEAAHRELMAGMASALEEDPARPVWAPGYGPGRRPMTAAALVEDQFAGRQGDAALLALLRLAAGAAKAHTAADLAPLRLQAQAWILERAREHADYHFDDAVDEGDA